MLENGDHANFVFAFFRPHVTSMFVLNTQSQPQIANPRIIITNQMALNVVIHLFFAECFQDRPLVNPQSGRGGLAEQRAHLLKFGGMSLISTRRENGPTVGLGLTTLGGCRIESGANTRPRRTVPQASKCVRSAPLPIAGGNTKGRMDAAEIVICLSRGSLFLSLLPWHPFLA